MLIQKNLRNWYARKRIRWINRRLLISKVRGVIHIGANSGGEATTYDIHDLRVAWVEPIPEVFQELCHNISAFHKQRAYRYLIGEKDQPAAVLHVSSNDGLSSSILPLAKHREAWPNVSYKRDLVMPSTSLPTFVRKEGLDLSEYEALIMDTQGSELTILRGATEILPRFRFIHVEVADFEAYAGCCLLSEMDDFMSNHGFREVRRDIQTYDVSAHVGNYYEVTYASTL
jgi:FkbM family methyltransferase